MNLDNLNIIALHLCVPSFFIILEGAMIAFFERKIGIRRRGIHAVGEFLMAVGVAGIIPEILLRMMYAVK